MYKRARVGGGCYLLMPLLLLLLMLLDGGGADHTLKEVYIDEIQMET